MYDVQYNEWFGPIEEKDNEFSNLKKRAEFIDQKSH